MGFTEDVTFFDRFRRPGAGIDISTNLPVTEEV